MIRVLIVYRDFLDDNLYVQTLRDGLCRAGCRVECSAEKFWNCKDEFDIVHLQWPEELFMWGKITEDDVVRLKKRIADIKEQGIKIVYTRHNIVPHYADEKVIQVYKIIEEAADGIVHMGYNSLTQISCSGSAIGAAQCVIPHHIYENTYNEHISKEQARKVLKIPRSAFVICVFGKFRNKEEVKMVLKAFFSTQIKHKYLLAPRMLLFSSNTFFKQVFRFFVTRMLRMVHIQAGNYDQLVSNLELPYYISASDILLIQRKQILNSGNVPLAFLFKKVVAGPDRGNVGELLKDSGNPVFDPSNDVSVADALQRASDLAGKGYGIENYEYAKKNMNMERVASLYLDFYRQLLGINA